MEEDDFTQILAKAVREFERVTGRREAGQRVVWSKEAAVSMGTNSHFTWKSTMQRWIFEA